MKRRLFWGVLLIVVLLRGIAVLSNYGDAWSTQYCNAAQTFCITPLQQHTNTPDGITTTLYSGKDFRPFLRSFNSSRLILLHADEQAFDQEQDGIVVYTNGTAKPLNHHRIPDWQAVRVVHVDSDPCAFITSLKYNYTPAARCWRGQFHE